MHLADAAARRRTGTPVSPKALRQTVVEPGLRAVSHALRAVQATADGMDAPTRTSLEASIVRLAMTQAGVSCEMAVRCLYRRRLEEQLRVDSSPESMARLASGLVELRQALGIYRQSVDHAREQRLLQIRACDFLSRNTCDAALIAQAQEDVQPAEIAERIAPVTTTSGFGVLTYREGN